MPDESELTRSSNEQLERKLARSRWFMLIEQVWPRLWLPAGVAGIFVLASTLGLWPLLPGLLHALLLLLFLAAFIASFHPLRRLSLPERADAIRWLETRSRLPHRPASALDDRLAPGDGASASLWRAHQRRMRQRVDAMRTGLPRPNTPAYDPYALRVPLLLALFIVIGLYPQNLVPGLAEALRFGSDMPATEMRLDAWITPPAHIGGAPVLLSDGGAAVKAATTRALTVPANSELTVRIWGEEAAAARLVLTPAGEPGAPPPDAAGADIRTTEVKTTEDNNVREMRARLMGPIRAELTLGRGPTLRWDIGVTPDHPPVIALTEPPAGTVRGSLRLAYRVADDYGVVSGQATFRRVEAKADGSLVPVSPAPASPRPDDLTIPFGEAPEVSLVLPKARGQRGNAATYADLTAHLWAGQQVELTLTARDEAGNTGASEPVTFALPERRFSKPLARALADARRRLAARPGERLLIAQLLDDLTRSSVVPIDSASVYLGLRSAYWRLTSALDRDTIRSVIDQMWEIALAIEDNNISQAENDLRAAQDKLTDALARNAPPEELEQLMKELRQALGQFLNAVAQQQKQPDPDAATPPGNEQMITARELEEMLRKIENLAKTGARDAAQQLLGQLRDMLENTARGQPQMSAGDQQMRQALDDLGRMIMQQRRLLDETHRSDMRRGLDGTRPMPGEDGAPMPGQGGSEGQNGQQPGEGQDGQGRGQGQGSGRAGSRGHGDLRQRQGELLDELNGLLDGLNRSGMPIPDDLMRAGGHMGRAERQLGDEELGGAQRQQGEALDKLRSGARSLVEKMMQNRQGRSGQTGRDNRDPLGRPGPTSGPEFSDEVKVPGQIETQRARDILEDLRRRLGQSRRPADELDYLERLIEQF